MSSQITPTPLRFLHIGDVHVTDAGLQNHLDLARIIGEVNANVGNNLDFVFLPGDNADDGTSEQFGLVFAEMSRLRLPWRAIPGDHDFKPRSLEHFYSTLRCNQLPFAEEIRGCACLFLDVVSAGTGGPDFRLGRDQIEWLRQQIASARRDGKTIAVFMHTYPSDLGEEAAEVAALIDDSPVVLVDMGHTHYNELANDGRTVYAATRSTGQIEEGDAGFAIVAVDDGAVSWRFKTIGSSWPFVMITSPADRRLVVDDTPPEQLDHCEFRASVWGAREIVTAEVSIDDGGWLPMTLGGAGIMNARVSILRTAFKIRVRARDADGNADTDTIEVDPISVAERRPSSGSDAGSIGAWPERHLLGTQLGPNRNGRKW
jgi:3',5'-cyclic-AMP phosphodiesterase